MKNLNQLTLTILGLSLAACQINNNVSGSVNTGGGSSDAAKAADPISQILNPAPAVDPMKIDGLEAYYTFESAHLEKSGNRVSKIVDQSGKGRDLVQASAGAQPVQSGTDAPIEFDGAMWMSAGDVLGDVLNGEKVTVLAIALPDKTVSVEQPVWSKGEIRYSFTSILAQSSGIDYFLKLFAGSGRVARANDTYTYGPTGLSTDWNNLELYGLSIDRSQALSKQFRAGSNPVAALSHSSASCNSAEETCTDDGRVDTTGEEFILGADQSNGFRGQFVALAIFSRSLSSAEMKAASCYAREKFGISLSAGNCQ